MHMQLRSSARTYGDFQSSMVLLAVLYSIIRFSLSRVIPSDTQSVSMDNYPLGIG